jgi:hypothetical protein
MKNNRAMMDKYHHERLTEKYHSTITRIVAGNHHEVTN